MGYRLNRLDGPVLMAVPNIMLTFLGIHYRQESCDGEWPNLKKFLKQELF